MAYCRNISNCLRCHIDYAAARIRHIDENIKIKNNYFDKDEDPPEEFFETPICHDCVWEVDTKQCCVSLRYPDHYTEKDGEMPKNFGYEVINGFVRVLKPETTTCRNEMTPELEEFIKSNIDV